MKKALLFAVVVGAVSLTACTKDYTCTCTFTDGTTESGVITDVKKSEAQDSCDIANALVSGFGLGTCELD